MSLTAQAPQPNLAWTFEGSTTDYITGLTGATTGTVTYGPGKYNQCISIFNVSGTTAASNLVTWTISFGSATGFTVATWVRMDGAQSAALQNTILGFTGFPNSNAATINYFNMWQRAGPLTFGFYGQNGTTLSQDYQPTIITTTTPTIGTWYHYTLTVNSTTFTVYINGVQNGTPVSVGNAFTLNTMYLARSGQVNALAGINSVDDLRIYNTALTAAQVQSVYNQQGMPGRGAGFSQYIKSATGGDTVQDIGGYRIHTFTTVGTSTFTPATAGLVEVLVVAGGGGGGCSGTSIPGGGGGAGEVYYAPVLSLSQSAYTINIGSGGTGSSIATVRSVNGHSSNIFLGASSVISTNGGGGGGNGSQSTASPQNIYQQPQDGGSGGGCGRYANVSVVQAISVTTSPGGLGNPGGFPGGQVNRGSGGGGATSAGGVGVNNGAIGLGGSGFSSSVSGNSQTYGTGGDGGNGTGGAGANGAANTGNGGGGAGATAGVAGGNGGSGIVIVRYPIQVTLTGTPLFSQIPATATSSAVAAFSLRAVNGTTAKAVQVKRQSDNATQDFWADRLGNLLTAPVVGQPLASWLGGSTGNVVTWYDQSGAGNDATQATDANQPVIQKATKGPGYSCYFAGAPNQMSFNSATGNIFDNTDFTVCAVTRRSNAYAGTFQFFMGTSPTLSTVPSLKFGYVSDTLVRTQINNIAVDNVNVNVSAYAGASEPTGYNMGMLSQTSGMVAYAWRSGTPTTGTAPLGITPGTLSGPGTLGCSRNSQFFIGEIYELLVFTTSLYDLDGTSTINQIYNNQLGMYGN